MKPPVRRFLALSCLLAAGHAALGADSPRDSALESWRADRFGLFVHWGPISLKGTEIGWSRAGERRGYRRGPPSQVPVDVYDNLYKEFNPVRFDAREWVAIAQAAGMKYLVFTSRHHDGFSMFDTQASDYKITSPLSPFHRDVVRELADACHEAGLKFGLYYSQPNWRHPDAFIPERHSRYLAFLKTQVRELLTNYGRVDILWFDGLRKTAADYGADELNRMARELQPHLLINNRNGLPEDFDTPEQRVGTYQDDRPWESCITICRQWAWKPNDDMKSLEQCLQTLVRSAGGDGNLLLNVGPMPDGRIEPRQIERLKEMGAWLAKNGESIYGTRGGPFKPADYGASTRRGQMIYVHVLKWPEGPVRLPNIAAKIVSAKVLSGGRADVRQTESGIEISVAPADRDASDTVVALKLESDAMMIPALAVASPASDRPTNPVTLPAQVFVVPNFHPASCGWLVNWSVERNYCANSYLDHLDRVRDDANYHFVMSECNNMIAIRNFQPERFAELKKRVAEGRVELVNAFFLEPSISLSGGEALAKMGIEGLRWQQQVMGARPRFGWMIDVCGTHAQMPQLCSLLGLDALIYTRGNRSGKTVFWSDSPDGSRILTLVPGHYSDNIGGIYGALEPLNENQLEKAAQTISSKLRMTPAGAPVLILAGQGDYALAPARRENPTELLQRWKSFRPDCELRFTGLSSFVDALLPGVKSGKIELPAVSTGTGYVLDSFWIECPRVKTWYRRDEHALQSAEALATIASLKSGFDYPAQSFYHAWLQMFLNMDRNTLWGAAGGMVFEHPTSWDAADRFAWVERESTAALDSAARRLAGEGQAVALFNFANWKRTDPVRLRLPADTTLAVAPCEAAGDGTTLCQLEVPATGFIGVQLQSTPPAAPKSIELPHTIETKFYSARIDPASGALVSLKTRPSGREMLGGPANVIVAEKHTGRADAGDFTNVRPRRPRLASSSDFETTLTVTEGPLAITVEADSRFFGGGASRRVTRFFKDHPRIEFETVLHDIPNLTVVVAEFPLAEAPQEIRRGIPFGFSRDDGAISGIVPAVRWSAYTSPGKGGVALLDRGLTGREINGRTPIIYLLNATDTYRGFPNDWLSGKGTHRFEYALVAHEGDWSAAHIPQRAWEYNTPVSVATGCRAARPQSFVQTSDNVIVEALRRDGADIELRVVEVLAQTGTAAITLNLPHLNAAMTDLNGNHAQKLSGGPAYHFPIRPQQIVTLRFRTDVPVAEIMPLTEWDELVPPPKRPALHEHLKDVKGHPPRGS